MTPEEAYAEVQKGFQAYGEQRFAAAEGIADNILSNLPEDPNGLYLKGICRRVATDFTTALDLIQKACTIAPGVLSFRLAVGQVLSDMQRFEDAIACFRQLMTDFPDEVLPRIRLADLFLQLGAVNEAVEAADAGLFIDPDNHELHLLMAHVYDRQQDVNGMIYHADKALHKNEDWYDAILIRARADILKKDYYAAINRLNKVTPPSEFQICERSALLGDAFHQLKDYKRAMDAWDDGNKTARNYVQEKYAQHQSAVNLDGVKRARHFFQTMAESGEVGRPATNTAKSPIFLVGFPRSGVAMVDQLLSAHPNIDPSDQRNCFVPVIHEFGISEESLQRFHELTEEQLQALRDAYWERVNQSGMNLEDKIYIERSPLGLTWLGLIGRLFPEARVIIAVRDPRDTILATYQTNFDMNAAVFHLLDINEAAEYYDASLGAAYAGLKLCPGLQVHEVQFEQLLLNFEDQVTRLFHFLGIDVDPQSFNLGKSISTEGEDNTPSISLVNQLLYSSSVGKWQHYSEALEPVDEILNPWIKRFGYTA